MEEFDLFSNGTWIGDHERYPRMGEYIRVIKGLWTDPDFNFDGTFYRAHVQAAMKGADGKVGMPDLRRRGRKAKPIASSPDLCCQSRSRRQGADRAIWRCLVRRIQTGVPQLRRQYRAHGRRCYRPCVSSPRRTGARFNSRSIRRSSWRRHPGGSRAAGRGCRAQRGRRAIGWSMRSALVWSAHRSSSRSGCAAMNRSASIRW